MSKVTQKAAKLRVSGLGLLLSSAHASGLCYAGRIGSMIVYMGVGEDKREKGRPGTSTMVSTPITGTEAGCFTRPEDLRTQVDSFLEWGWG